MFHVIQLVDYEWLVDGTPSMRNHTFRIVTNFYYYKTRVPQMSDVYSLVDIFYRQDLRDIRSMGNL